MRLLPAFDQYVVAAPRGDDDVVLATERARVYRPQGWLSPVLLVDGRMAGVWSHERKGERLIVEVEPFGRLTRAVRAGLRDRGRGARPLPRRRARAEPVIGWSDVARLKIAYIGGGSTRAAGTMASFIEQGANFAGSEIVLIDLDAERLELIRGLAERMAAAKGVDLTVSATTDRRAGLDGCDAILTSYRPGGFEARVLDERIPLTHGVIGQETQGPGGFFMALRSIHVMRQILDDVAVACPGARIFNYTNPVNIVAQAVTDHSDVPFVSLCEGPIIYAEEAARAAGLDPEQLDVAERRAQPRLVERPAPLRRPRTCCRCWRRPPSGVTSSRRRGGCCAWRR